MCLDANDLELARPKLQSQPEVVIQTASNPEQQARSELVPVSIESEPAGADVYLDGAFVGSTPLPNYGIGAGEHVLEISMSGFAKWSRKILVQAGAPTRFRATLEASPATLPPSP